MISWFKLLLSMVFFFMLFVGLGMLIPHSIDSYHANNYRSMDINAFYEVCSLTAQSVPYGSYSHKIFLRANNSLSDWDSNINRELLMVKSNNVSTLYFQDGFPATLERRDCDETLEVVFPLPDGLSSGVYVWRVQFVIYLPYDVVRELTVVSEPFYVGEVV